MRDLYIRWMELLEPVPGDHYLARLPVVKYPWYTRDFRRVLRQIEDGCEVP